MADKIDPLAEALVRVNAFTESLRGITEGKRLRCLTCGKTVPPKPDTGSYWTRGWPRCCGYTMRLEDDRG